jgi:hypothetical protein
MNHYLQLFAFSPCIDKKTLKGKKRETLSFVPQGDPVQVFFLLGIAGRAANSFPACSQFFSCMQPPRLHQGANQGKVKS